MRISSATGLVKDYADQDFQYADQLLHIMCIHIYIYVYIYIYIYIYIFRVYICLFGFYIALLNPVYCTGDSLGKKNE